MSSSSSSSTTTSSTSSSQSDLDGIDWDSLVPPDNNVIVNINHSNNNYYNNSDDNSSNNHSSSSNNSNSSPNSEERARSVSVSVSVSVRRRRNFTVPRLLKSDLQRQYGVMFANALNSAHREMIEMFFLHYGTHCMALNKRNVNPALNFSLQIQGCESVSRYWASLFDITPDQVFRIEAMQVRTCKGDPGCRLFARFAVDGTRVHNINPQVIAQSVVANAEREILSYIPHPITPFKFSFSGQFVLFIGADKRIQRVDIEVG